MTIILFIGLIEALFDFAVWYGIYKEHSGHKYEWIFRTLKALIDFLIIPAIAYFIFDVQLGILAAFFIAKWFHLCDSYYNIFRYILTNESTAVWGFWRWWTPLGLLRCNWWGFCVLPGFTELDMDAQYGNWSTDCYKRKYLNYPDYNFLKGMVSINEAWIQTALGLFLTAIILLIWA